MILKCEADATCKLCGGKVAVTFDDVRRVLIFKCPCGNGDEAPVLLETVREAEEEKPDAKA